VQFGSTTYEKRQQIEGECFIFGTDLKKIAADNYERIINTINFKTDHRGGRIRGIRQSVHRWIADRGPRRVRNNLWRQRNQD
jgi:hypothetical protein